jgi:hypothetical protein
MLVLLKHNTEGTLQEIFDCAGAWLRAYSYQPEPRNVSYRVAVNGINIDVTPAKKQTPFGMDASIWRSKVGKRAKTNIAKQISHVKASGRIAEIRLTKIWRNVHKVEFPSVALELAVIRALRDRRVGFLEPNLRRAFEWLADDLLEAPLEDPGNPSNDVAEDLTQQDRAAIAAHAFLALHEPWEYVIP